MAILFAIESHETSRKTAVGGGALQVFCCCIYSANGFVLHEYLDFVRYWAPMLRKDVEAGKSVGRIRLRAESEGT